MKARCVHVQQARYKTAYHPAHTVYRSIKLPAQRRRRQGPEEGPGASCHPARYESMHECRGGGTGSEGRYMLVCEVVVS